jgi:hypothetical protein
MHSACADHQLHRTAGCLSLPLLLMIHPMHPTHPHPVFLVHKPGHLDEGVGQRLVGRSWAARPEYYNTCLFRQVQLASLAPSGRPEYLDPVGLGQWWLRGRRGSLMMGVVALKPRLPRLQADELVYTRPCLYETIQLYHRILSCPRIT